jgi:hypothetical protein
MAVYVEGKALEGTVRKPTPREVVLKRRENRRLWKLNAAKGRKSSIDGKER